MDTKFVGELKQLGNTQLCVQQSRGFFWIGVIAIRLNKDQGLHAATIRA